MKNNKGGLIIGMSALAITGTLAGLIGGYCIPRGGKAQAPDGNGGNSQVSQEKDFTEYLLPENMAQGTVYVNEVTNRYSLVSSDTAGATYLIDKETKENTFLCTGRVVIDSPVSEVVNNKCLVAFQTGMFDVRLLDLETKTMSKIDSKGTTDYAVTFLGKEENNIYFCSNSNFWVFDIEQNTSKIFALNNSELNYSNPSTSVLNLKDYYVFSYSYDQIAKMFIIDKNTNNVMTMNDYGITKGTEVIKDNGVYFASTEGPYSGRGLYYLNISSLECSQLKSIGSGTQYTVKEYSNGALYFAEGYQVPSYFIKYSDNSVEESASGNCYEYGGAVFGAFTDGTSANLNLTKFNASTGNWDVVYTANINMSTFYRTYTFVEFNGNVYASLYENEYSNFVTLRINKDLTLTKLSIDARNFTKESVKLSSNEFLFCSGGITYCNLKKDLEIVLAHNTGLVDYAQDGDIVTIITSDGFKREFNTKTMVVKTVAIYDEI